jgi:uncharacterized protein YkwD
MSFAPLVFAFVLTSGAFHVVPAPHPAVRDAAELVRLDASSTMIERDDDAAAMLATMNAERASRGLAPLAFDDRLSAIARSHAEDMVQRSYFGHSTPEGVTPFERMARAHYRFSYAGENLALDENVAAAGNALWNSREHRSNILEPHFERVGIAAVASTDGEIFVVDFSD